MSAMRAALLDSSTGFAPIGVFQGLWSLKGRCTAPLVAPLPATAPDVPPVPAAAAPALLTAGLPATAGASATALLPATAALPPTTAGLPALDAPLPAGESPPLAPANPLPPPATADATMTSFGSSESLTPASASLLATEREQSRFGSPLQAAANNSHTNNRTMNSRRVAALTCTSNR